MNRIVYGVGVALALVASSAVAAPPFGEVKDAAKCQEGIDRMGPRKEFCEPGYEPNLTPECKAEQDKRVAECKKRPADAQEQSDICKKRGYPFEDTKANLDKYCKAAVWAQMVDQSAQAAKAAIEVPEATMKDPKLEKAVAAAYVKEGYGENKVIRVVLQGWADELEKDAFGKVTGRDLSATVVNKHPDGKCELHSELWMQRGNGKSFSGPLSARGAGSLNQTEIPCEKAEAGAGASKPGKKK